MKTIRYKRYQLTNIRSFLAFLQEQYTGALCTAIIIPETNTLTFRVWTGDRYGIILAISNAAKKGTRMYGLTKKMLTRGYIDIRFSPQTAKYPIGTTVKYYL